MGEDHDPRDPIYIRAHVFREDVGVGEVWGGMGGGGVYLVNDLTLLVTLRPLLVHVQTPNLHAFRLSDNMT